MESTRLLSGIRANRVREHVRKYFNPEDLNPTGFRGTIMLGLLGLVLSEMVVYTLLQHSADLGELPQNIADALIISISLLEFMAVPLISWVGARRRRSMLVGFTVAALLVAVPLFALPAPDTTVDPGLCSIAIPLGPRSFSTSISVRAAVRLSMLLICGVVTALARAVYLAHGLAYLDECNPSDNLHMHVGVLLLHRVMVYVLASSMRTMIIDLPWLQILIIVIKYLISLFRLHRYPEAPPVGEKYRGNDRGLFQSLGRVLGSRVAVLQMFAMALLVAAWWGFGMSETAFVQVKYHIRPDNDSQIGMLNMNIRTLPILLGVLLAGYIYTTPVMPKFDRRAALTNVGRMSFLVALVYVLMTVLLKCNRSGFGGLHDLKYTQPACGQNCGCDRPWMEFTPVCAPEQMTTFFSPCHAGCATADTVNNVGVYSNCTCAPGGVVTVGACGDGSCANVYSLHQMFYVVVALASTLAFVWQITVLIESVDKRDVATAVGLASATVSIFAFAGAHGFYMGISSYTCAYFRGSKCLLQNDHFAPWVGYSSAVLACLSLILTIITCIILRRQREPKEEDLSL